MVRGTEFLDAAGNVASTAPLRSCRLRELQCHWRERESVSAQKLWLPFPVIAPAQVKFSGITWSGLETPYAAPGGLQMRSLDSHLDQIAKLGFNMMRLPFAGATLYDSTYPQPGRVSASPELAVSSLRTP